MQPRLLFAVLLSIAIAAALNAPASAASPSTTATSDLIPGPPPGSWTIDTAYTGPITGDHFYATTTAAAAGFVDAYEKEWYQPDIGLNDQLAHYNSAASAIHALSSFEFAGTKDPKVTSFRSISGFGDGAFEVTLQPNTAGWLWDETYFAVGDYVAAIGVYVTAASLGATGTIDHSVLFDYSSRQFASLPAATAELPSTLNGRATAVVGVAFVAGIDLLVLYLLFRLFRQRRLGPALQQSASPPFSPDGKWWWDGQQWVSAVSSDGLRSWNGAAWVPVRKMFVVDYATHSIFAAVMGFLCGLLWPYGFWCGYLAYKELAHRRTQAIVGMALNGIGCVLLVVLFIYGTSLSRP